MSVQLVIRCVKNMDREHLVEFLNDVWDWAIENDQHSLIAIMEDREMFLPPEANNWEIELVRVHFKTLIEGCIDFTDDHAQLFLTYCLEDLGWEFDWR